MPVVEIKEKTIPFPKPMEATSPNVADRIIFVKGVDPQDSTKHLCTVLHSLTASHVGNAKSINIDGYHDFTGQIIISNNFS